MVHSQAIHVAMQPTHRCNRRKDWGQIWNAANFRGLDGLPLQFRGYGPKFLEELIDALGRKGFAFRGL